MEIFHSEPKKRDDQGGQRRVAQRQRVAFRKPQIRHHRPRAGKTGGHPVQMRAPDDRTGRILFADGKFVGQRRQRPARKRRIKPRHRLFGGGPAEPAGPDDQTGNKAKQGKDGGDPEHLEREVILNAE